jgi:hypothetical protein
MELVAGEVMVEFCSVIVVRGHANLDTPGADETILTTTGLGLDKLAGCIVMELVVEVDIVEIWGVIAVWGEDDIGT